MTEYFTPIVKVIDHRKIVFEQGSKELCTGVSSFMPACELALSFGGGLYCPTDALPYSFENEKLADQGLQMVETGMGDRMIEPLYGATLQELDHAQEAGMKIVTAACPIVKRFQNAPAQLAEQGATPVIAGIRESREVQLALERAPAGVQVVENAEEAQQLDFIQNYGLCLQTHFTLDLATPLIAALRARCDKLSLVDTSCSEIRMAYNHARLMALAADLVFILGPANNAVVLEMARRIELLKKTSCIIDGEEVPDIPLNEKLGHIGLVGSPYSAPEQFEKIGKLLKEKYAGGVFEVKWQPEIPDTNKY
jgi:4-hydroxy-3-methylbut-2-enyl diphosphate reductase IspH